MEDHRNRNVSELSRRIMTDESSDDLYKPLTNLKSLETQIIDDKEL
jgi:hypothetical protein